MAAGLEVCRSSLGASVTCLHTADRRFQIGEPFCGFTKDVLVFMPVAQVFLGLGGMSNEKGCVTDPIEPCTASSF